MKGAIIHGVLLAVMLVYGYRTWTRDKTVGPDLGSVVLWDKADSDLVSIEWKSDSKVVKLERRTGTETYWWGSDTTITKTPKPVTPPPTPPDQGSGAGSGSAAGSGAGSGSAGSAAGSGAGSGSAGSAAGSGAGSGSAGSGAGSGSAGSAATPPPPEMVETKKTREFPLGETGDKLVKSLTAARAIRDLGSPTPEAKKDYKLDDAKTTLTVTFKDGSRSFLIGGPVYGGSDRYALEPASGKAFVLSKDLISGLEVGESSLHLTDPRGFDAAKIESVTIEGGGKTKTAVRVQAGEEGKQVKTWGDEATKKPNQTIANFIDNANNLRPTEYSAEVKTVGLEPVVTLTYKDERGAVLGTLSLYKHQKAPTPPAEGQPPDMTNPLTPETEYFIMTPRTRVPAIVRKDTAERTEQDVPTVFSDKPQSVDPKGNPFGKVPPGALNPHGGNPPGPPGPPGPSLTPGGGSAAAPTPGAGSAAVPTPAAGSAAAPGTKPATPPAAKPPAPKPTTPTAPKPAAPPVAKPAAAPPPPEPAPAPAPAPTP